MSKNGKHASAEGQIWPTCQPVFVAHSEPVTYRQYLGDEVSQASKPVVIESASHQKQSSGSSYEIGTYLCPNATR